MHSLFCCSLLRSHPVSTLVRETGGSVREGSGEEVGRRGSGVRPCLAPSVSAPSFSFSFSLLLIAPQANGSLVVQRGKPPRTPPAKNMYKIPSMSTGREERHIHKHFSPVHSLSVFRDSRQFLGMLSPSGFPSFGRVHPSCHEGSTIKNHRNSFLLEGPCHRSWWPYNSDRRGEGGLCRLQVQVQRCRAMHAWRDRTVSRHASLFEATQSWKDPSHVDVRICRLEAYRLAFGR